MNVVIVVIVQFFVIVFVIINVVIVVIVQFFVIVFIIVIVLFCYCSDLHKPEGLKTKKI